MESQSTSPPGSSKAVKDIGQPVTVAADEEKAVVGAVPTADESQENFQAHDSKNENKPGPPAKVPDRQRTIHGVKVFSLRFLKS